MELSDALLHKYNFPVPRYTSYPPANQFSDAFLSPDYIDLLEESNQEVNKKMAIYIHIPFCRKICYYCGCNACSTGSGRLVNPYLEALKKEIIMVAAHLNNSRKVSQIHYGGGTPNSIDFSRISALNEFLCSHFNIMDNPEIAIECHPAYLDSNNIVSLKQAGFNRFSIGVQDFNPSVLAAVNREFPVMPLKEMIELLRDGEEGISVNLDFIYGLPGQTVESFSETINKAVSIRPDRLVTFSYAHVPWLKKHQEILEKRGLPLPELKMKMFLAAYRMLRTNGYRSIGLDHFVLPGDELEVALKNRELHRNFQGYCTRRTTGQVYAFGVSAISQLDGGYSQNTKSIESYIRSIGNGELAVERGLRLNFNQRIIRQVITDLMCNKELIWAEEAAALNIREDVLKEALEINSAGLDNFVGDGLLEYYPGGLRVTEQGSFFIRNIAAALDPVFRDQPFSYSRSV